MINKSNVTLTTSLDSIREANIPWLIIKGQAIKSKMKIWPEARPITARVTWRRRLLINKILPFHNVYNL